MLDETHSGEPCARTPNTEPQLNGRDYKTAARFLHILDPNAEAFTFQTFDDSKERKSPELARTFHASLADVWGKLVALNKLGAGVFYTVNETDGSGRRKTENITRVRAVWHDDDGDGYNPLPGEAGLFPNAVVETSPGKRQRLWVVDGMSSAEHAAAQDAMVLRGSDPNAKGINRVLRLPGTYHMKGAPTLVRLADDPAADGNPARYSAAELANGFPSVAFAPRKAPTPRAAGDFNRAEVVKALMCVPVSDDRDTWLRVGMMLQECGDPGFDLWCLWSAQSAKFDAEDQARVWESFSGDKARLTTLASLYALAGRHGYVSPGASEADTLADFAPVVDVAKPADFGARFFNLALSDDEQLAIPPRAWIVKNRLERGELSIAVAQGGTGKSLWALHTAFAVALGGGTAAEYGMDVREQAKVLYISTEDRPNDVKRRAMAFSRKWGVPLASVGKSITVYDATKGRLKLAIRDAKGKTCRGPDADALTAQIRDGGYGLVIIDPLVKFHELNENDNVEMNALVDVIRDIAQSTDAAVLVIHHTNKPKEAGSTGAGDSNSGRGASAIRDAARILITITAMDEATAKRFGVPEDVRLSHFRLDDGKINHGPRGGTPEWLRIHGVTLPNGEAAPALEPVRFGTAVGVTREQASAVALFLARITESGEWQSYSAGPQARRYLPRVIADDNAVSATGMTADRVAEVLMNMEGVGTAEQAGHGRRNKNGEVPKRWRAVLSKV